jgi:hypothetical protein
MGNRGWRDVRREPGERPLDGVPRFTSERRGIMASRTDRGTGVGGISLGGILVIIGIVLMIVWSFWVGLIVLLVGLIAFGGFARGKWY